MLNAGRGALYPEWGTVLGIAQIETLNTMQIRAYRAFFQRYVDPAVFRMFEEEANRMGFSHAAVGPMVRSSYHADQQAHLAGVV